MYRILTEDKNRELVYAILDQVFDGYTITEAVGAWKGNRERSLVIDLVNSDGINNIAFESLVITVCERIKKANQQEAVMYLIIPSETVFI